MFCLARAFVRKSSILIMDEATASIDMATVCVCVHVCERQRIVRWEHLKKKNKRVMGVYSKPSGKFHRCYGNTK